MLEPVPAVTGCETGYTLDTSPACTHRDKQTFTCMANLESPCMSLDCGRKWEYPGRTCMLHTRSPSWPELDPNSGPSCCEVLVLATNHHASPITNHERHFCFCFFLLSNQIIISGKKQQGYFFSFKVIFGAFWHFNSVKASIW